MRREATRSALLDAAITCLIERGYAGATTVQIAEQAGVTRGAQLRYFATKEDLILAAVRHLNNRISAELLRTLPTENATIDVEALVDALWKFHQSPVFAAALELFFAARTDPVLRAQLKPLEADVLSMAGTAGTAVVPNFHDQPRARSVLVTTLSTMRGLAMLSVLYDDTSLTRLWQGHRSDLLTLWRTTLLVSSQKPTHMEES
jgi:AcrR family transcriptional regulator